MLKHLPSRVLASAPGRAESGCRFWPEAEDRALRGRNLSAVFRTLYQVGEGSLARGCPRSLPPTWVENQSDKSTLRTAAPIPSAPKPPVNNCFPSKQQTININHCKPLSVFPGQVQDGYGWRPDEVVGLSICIYRLHKSYQKALHDELDLDASMSAWDNLKTVSDYAGVVLNRIEHADRHLKLQPNVWKWYLKICAQWPLYKDRAKLANEKLGLPNSLE